jgi:hypothetical protein
LFRAEQLVSLYLNLVLPGSCKGFALPAIYEFFQAILQTHDLIGHL